MRFLQFWAFLSIVSFAMAMPYTINVDISFHADKRGGKYVSRHKRAGERTKLFIVNAQISSFTREINKLSFWSRSFINEPGIY